MEWQINNVSIDKIYRSEQSKDGNWNIEKYDLWHDLQDREMALELQGIPTKVFIEFTNGTIEEDRIVA